jgi:DMSO/TMAO reductase YedYZ heme-binding membrane subunit
MKDPAFAKFVVLINGSVPLALLCWDALHHELGANPTAFAIRTTGMLTLVFLTLSLAVTPIRLISGQNWLSHFRRMLGLYAFFYGVLHLSTYFVFDRSLSVAGTISDTLARPFIFFGMTGLLLMVPLAATSTNGMIKRLGAAKWKRLHRLAYVSAAAGVLHYYLLVKADTRQPLAFAAVLAALLVYRILNARFPGLRRGGRKPLRSGSTAVAR